MGEDRIAGREEYGPYSSVQPTEAHERAGLGRRHGARGVGGPVSAGYPWWAQGGWRLVGKPCLGSWAGDERAWSPEEGQCCVCVCGGGGAGGGRAVVR